MAREAAPTASVAAWVRVCDVADLEVDRGASALVRGKQVALFRTGRARVLAVGNRDPFTGTPTIARGIVGRTRGRPWVAAPAGHQRFDLAAGHCLDDLDARLPAFGVRLVDGYVEVHVPGRARAGP